MNLSRFVEAQKPSFASARRELLAGAKASHWMWYIFPQLAGLGQSATARRYGITSLAEAQAYIAHPLLGPRLIELTRIVLTHGDKSPRAIFGSPDDMKFRSSMTLFALAAPQHPEFGQALGQFYDGPDPRTLALLGVEWPA